MIVQQQNGGIKMLTEPVVNCEEFLLVADQDVGASPEHKQVLIYFKKSEKCTFFPATKHLILRRNYEKLRRGTVLKPSGKLYIIWKVFISSGKFQTIQKDPSLSRQS